MSARAHVGLFASERELMDAVRECREKAIPIREVYSPYPVHGIDELMGIRRSRLTLVCFFGGLAGLALGLGFEYWSSAVDWPLNVGGKPFDSLPAFIPVGFEMTVLFGGLATALMLMVRSRLWPGKGSRHVIEGVTDDRFALVIAEADASLPPAALPDILQRHGAIRVWEEIGP